MKSVFHSSSPYLPALTFFLHSFLQSSLISGSGEVDIDDPVTQLLTYSMFTSYKTAFKPLLTAKRSFSDQSCKKHKYIGKNTWFKGSLIAQTLSKTTLVGSFLRHMISMVMDFWARLQYQAWNLSCAAGLISNQKAVGNPITIMPLLYRGHILSGRLVL